MKNTAKNFELCDDAQSLLMELGGIDKTKDEFNDLEALKKMDDWRVRLVELVEYLVLTLKTATQTDQKMKNDLAFRKLLEIYKFLSGVPSDDGRILIRYRGIKLDADRTDPSGEFDYVISLGGIWIDIPMARELTRRQLVPVNDLPQRLSRAFRILAAMKLHTLKIDISNWSQENMKRMHASIYYLSKYLTSASTAPDKFTPDGKQLDINLYVFAALNGLKGEKLQQLVQYTEKMKNHPETRQALSQVASTFDAIFAFKHLKARFVKPVIELNNIVYLELLRDCFDKDGRFKRERFEKHLPRFARWEKMVFKFLWRDLKSITDRRDRVSFLNSLRRMIHYINDPENPFYLMIRDFCDNSEGVKFSDRNAIVLTSILLSRYDQHIQFDIEQTPYEVFSYKVDSRASMAEKARAFLDGDGKNIFLNKVDVVRTELRKSLNADPGDTDVMPVRYLLSLAREIYIFLTLAGGATAHQILRSALEEYGNPDARIYSLKGSQKGMNALIQLLQVTIRCLGRLGHQEDMVLFEQIRKNEKRFVGLRLPDHPEVARHADLVRMTLKYLDKRLAA